MSKEMGTLRPSQLIYYYGPGAIVDMMDQSVMIMAADLWNTWNAPTIKDPRINKLLDVKEIKILNDMPDKIKIRAVPFPKWKICPKCGMMTDFNSKHCYFCKKNGEEVELYPSRFVVACKNGHISDFPYIEWVHQHKEEVCEKPILKFIREGSSGSLSDLYVRCVKCNARQSLANIMKKGILKSILPQCTGEMPWINEKGSCTETMDTYLRGGSNVYSPAVASFLRIPLSEQIQDPLIKKVNDSKTLLQKALELNNEDFFTQSLSMLGINESEKERVKQILLGDYGGEVSYESIRKQEWNTLILDKVDDSHDTGYKSTSVDIHEKMQSYFSAIHKVESLPEIQVLRGFTRLDYIDRFDTKQTDHLVSIMKDEDTGWLPGVQNNGEGIFFKFNEFKLKDWEQNTNHGDLTDEVIQKFNHQREQLGFSPLEIKSRHILLHTFSHAMIKELAAHSGYATTSLRERIYCSDNMYGVLIYTASGDSEGSLGGLIELAEPDKLYPIFIRAIEGMMYCSSDPNCSEGNFKYKTTANGAACHSCSFISETSCEWGNQLLDRRLLLNINLGETVGFFTI